MDCRSWSEFELWLVDLVGRDWTTRWSTAYSQLLPLQFPADADASLATLLTSESACIVARPMELPWSAVLARDTLGVVLLARASSSLSLRCRPFFPTPSPDQPNSRCRVVLSKPSSSRPTRGGGEDGVRSGGLPEELARVRRPGSDECWSRNGAILA